MLNLVFHSLFLIFFSLSFLYTYNNVDGYKKLFIFSLLIKIILIFINYNLFLLPDANGDAIGFNQHARDWSYEYDLLEILNLFWDHPFGTGGKAYTHTRIVAVIYELVGYHPYVIHTLNICFNFFSIVFCIKIIKIIYSKNSIDFTSLFLLLFSPSLFIYSVNLLKEPYVVFFNILAIYFLVLYLKNKNSIYVLISSSVFYINQYFAEIFIWFSIFLFLIFIIIVINRIIKTYIESIILKYSIFFTLFLFSLFVIIIKIDLPFISIFYIDNPIICDLNCQKNFNRGFIHKLVYLQEYTYEGIHVIPKYIYTNNHYDLLITAPFRLLYFYLFPFLIDVDSFVEIFLFIDSYIFLILIIMVFFYYPYIIKNNYLLFLSILLILFSIPYAFAHSNQGTLFRHRSKFLMIFITLYAPLLHYSIFELVFKKLYNKIR